MKRFMLFALTVLTLAGTTAFGAGLIIVEDSPLLPRHFPPNPPPWPHPRPYAFAPLEVSSVKVETRIKDQVAVTSVQQEFYNPNQARLEGTFVFPVPKGAHLDKFTMDIDGHPVEAELVSADKARRMYEDIVRKLRDPALLEYGDKDLFKVRIFPIEPNSRKRVSLSYTQLLKSDNGLVSYVLPMSAGKFSSQPIKNVSIKVELETKRPLKSIYSPSHSAEIKRDGPYHATAGYEATQVQPDADFALYFAPEKDEIGLNLLTFKRTGDDGYFLLLASPGMDVPEKEVILRDIVFVLDTSGSMAGKKLEQAKKALNFCIENLNDGDRFEILRFSTEVEPLFDKLVEANNANRSRAEDFVKDLKPMGATALEDAMLKALALRHRGSGTESETAQPSRPFVVIFLTDGMPTVGTTDENQIVAHVQKANEEQTRIFCFGIGTDVNTHLLDKITEATRAFSQYVLPEEDLEVKLSSFFSKIKQPVLANLTIQFTGKIRASGLYPSAVPDLFKGEQLVLVGRYSGHGPAAIHVEGTVNGLSRKFDYEASFPDEATETDFIPRLWATRRVGYLLDQIRLHGENPELRDEVAELARKYAIVTPYTAYLILEDESRRDVPTSMRSLQSLNQDHAAHEAAKQSWSDFKMERTGDSGVASAVAGLALRSANTPAAAPAEASEAFARRYGLAGRLSAPGVPPAAQQTYAPQSRLVSASQDARFVAGKTFFQTEKAWLDSEVQKAKDAKHVHLQFGAQDYFDFVAKHPQTLSWMALGQNVQFLFQGVVYEVSE
jgi:Ca-activated chloride channel family protein